MSFIDWMCQRGSLTRWVSWCTAVFTVRHLGTSPTISTQPLTSLLGFVCVLQTDSSSSYLAVDSTHGRRAFSIAGPTVWNSLPDELRDPACGSDSFKQFLKTVLFSLCTNVTSAELFLNDMRYIYPHLLTYLLVDICRYTLYIERALLCSSGALYTIE